MSQKITQTNDNGKIHKQTIFDLNYSNNIHKNNGNENNSFKNLNKIDLIDDTPKSSPNSQTTKYYNLKKEKQLQSDLDSCRHQ